MGAAAIEKITNPQRNFDMIERFEQKIGGARLERPSFGFLSRVGTAHEFLQGLRPFQTK